MTPTLHRIRREAARTVRPIRPPSNTVESNRYCIGFRRARTPAYTRGDWNDGFNRVGSEGKGEHLAWVLPLLNTGVVCRDTFRAQRRRSCRTYQEQATTLKTPSTHTAGTDTGSCVPSMMTARRSARKGATNAALMRSLKAGRPSQVPAT